jgi:hypothetical protein
MMAGGWLQSMHCRGQQLFDNRPGFFGVDWMFAGDFDQIGCVGYPVFSVNGEFKEGKLKEASEWTKAGCKLWGQYATSVTHLRRNHRHAKADKLLQTVLRAMHMRSVTPGMMNCTRPSATPPDQRSQTLCTLLRKTKPRRTSIERPTTRTHASPLLPSLEVPGRTAGCC